MGCAEPARTKGLALRVEIVHQPRKGPIATLEDTGSVWGKFSGSGNALPYCS